MKKYLSVICFVFVLVFVSGCSIFPKEAQSKTFSKSGMSITLTDEFYEKDIRSYTASYDSANVAVFALKEEFGLAEGLKDYSLDDYAKLVIDNNGKDVEVIKDNDLTYFVFENTANGKECVYFACVYKGLDAFWLIQFSCITDEYEDYKADFIKWAQSVEV